MFEVEVAGAVGRAAPAPWGSADPARVAAAARAQANRLGGVAVAGLAVQSSSTGEDLVELLGALSQLVAAAEACAARTAVSLDRLRRAEEEQAGIAARRRGEGVAAEVGLARHESVHRGRALLQTGRTLCTQMPHTLARLAEGDLTPWRATLMVREASCLDPADRARLDEALCADRATLAGLGDRAVVGAAQRWCAAEDPAAVVERRSRATSDRHVSLRPAPDTMAYLTALLPVAEGVATYKALLERAADAAAKGDERSRGQVMADALVARVTGAAEGEPPGVLVHLVMTDHAMFHGGREPGTLPGYGPVAAAAAREMVGGAASGSPGAFVRRLYVTPDAGALVAMDSRARSVPRGLADLVDVRDGGSCRMPWCDAPIRHHDHVVAAARGGATSAENLQGLCEAHNYAKEAPGWRSEPGAAPPRDTESHRARQERHVVTTRTPSGATYASMAPPLPGAVARTMSRDRDGASDSDGDSWSSAERFLARALGVLAPV